jgi:hypothetical protein
MLDIIGNLHAPAEEDQEPIQIPGWHINSTEPVEGWVAYRVEPTSPRRVFGGHPTFFYVFPDRETFEATRSQDEQDSI